MEKAFFETVSPEETRLLGCRLARKMLPGDTLLLRGDLGAGKSELARGIAAGLGVKETVPSPSFTICNAYESGRLPLYHFDWYRLADEEELYELGLDEYLGGDGVALVEWPERCEGAIPACCLEIRMSDLGGESRRLELISRGGFSLDRLLRGTDEAEQPESGKG